MQIISLLAIGFSFGAAALLVVGNILQGREPLRWTAKLAGFVLICGLAAIQSLHLGYVLHRFDAVHTPVYLLLLFCIAPSFYFYSRQLLIFQARYRRSDLLHAAPLLLCLVLPYQLALPGVFLIGSGYVLWLAKIVYLLRQQRQRFHLELLALATLFAIAIAVLVLGFIWPLLDQSAFIQSYSLLIGLAFFAVILTLLRFPDIAADVSEAVQAAYAESTLKNIDRLAVLVKLDALSRARALRGNASLIRAAVWSRPVLANQAVSDCMSGCWLLCPLARRFCVPTQRVGMRQKSF